MKYQGHYQICMRSIFFIFLLFTTINTHAQTTNICGNMDCSLITSYKYDDLCKKQSDITEFMRTKICAYSYTSCTGIGCKTLCHCKIYTLVNCCYPRKQCTTDFVKSVCGILN